MHIFEARLRPAYVPTTLEDIRASACEQLATYLREKPTLPGLPHTNFTQPWTDLDSGVRLPVVSCAFKRCRWKHNRVVELPLHLLEAPQTPNPDSSRISPEFLRGDQPFFGLVGFVEDSQTQSKSMFEVAALSPFAFRMFAEPNDSK